MKIQKRRGLDFHLKISVILKIRDLMEVEV